MILSLQLPSTLTEDEAFQVRKAEAFAILHHGDQKYGTRPYLYHLQRVVEVLGRFSVEEVCLLQSGFLHDVIEDTPTSREDVERMFGEDVADIVDRVSYVQDYSDHKDKLRKTYARIREREESVVLKVADRIANIEQNLREGGKIWNRYQKEYPEFRDTLRIRGWGEDLWDHLDDLMGK